MKTMIAMLALAISAVSPLMISEANAQAIQQIGYDNFGQPICAGPRGPGRCADIMAWMQSQQAMSMQQMGPAGIPTSVVPRDGQILYVIQQGCGGEPTCMAAAWGSVEVQRCNAGVGVPGGCFGPNGDIMRVVNRVMPQHLRPGTIINNAQSDLQNGPGRGNDLTGEDGFLRRTFGF